MIIREIIYCPFIIRFDSHPSRVQGKLVPHADYIVFPVEQHHLGCLLFQPQLTIHNLRHHAVPEQRNVTLLEFWVHPPADDFGGLAKKNAAIIAVELLRCILCNWG